MPGMSLWNSSTASRGDWAGAAALATRSASSGASLQPGRRQRLTRFPLLRATLLQGPGDLPQDSARVCLDDGAVARHQALKARLARQLEQVLLERLSIADD